MYAPQSVKMEWNEQVPPGVKFKVAREHSVGDKYHKHILTMPFTIRGKMGKIKPNFKHLL